MTNKYVNLQQNANLASKKHEKIERGQKILSSSVFNADSEQRDKIIVTIVNTGAGMKERTEKDLVKMLLDEEETAIQTI